MAKKQAEAMVRVDEEARRRLTSGTLELLPQARALVAPERVRDAAWAQEAGGVLRVAQTFLKRIETHYKPIRAAVRLRMQQALADIAEMEAADAGPCREANELLRKPVEDWLVADRERVQRENRLALEAAQARAREDRDREAEQIRRAAQAAPTATERKALERQARSVERSEPLPVMVGAPQEATKLAGVPLQVRKVAEVVDEVALLRGVLSGEVPRAAVTVNQSFLDEQATRLGKDLAYPGVVVREVPGLSVRSVK